MIWVVHYRLERAWPLAAAEHAALLAHVAAFCAGWRTARYGLEATGGVPMVAWGITALPLDFAHPDPERLLEALTALRGVVAGAALVIDDSAGLIGWDPDGRYALNAGVPGDGTFGRA